MERVRNKVVSGEPAPSGRMAETIAQHTETMNAVERLCLQSGGTLVALGRSNNKGFYSFVRKMMVWTDAKAHPTTSAQCISAIQDLRRALDGIKLTQPEPANLPFQPLAKDRVDKESLKKLREALKVTLEKQVAFLADPNADGIVAKHEAMSPLDVENFDASSVENPLFPALARISTVNGDVAKPEDADWFGELNPFTCAHTFRALAPSEHLISKGCWSALFGILWALKRTYPNYRGASGVAMPHSLPTAFVTSHCIDAIESLVQALGRREARFECLIELIAELEKLKSATLEVQYSQVSLDHQKRTLCKQIVTSLIVLCY